ncbi:MAG: outer membrane lipoprotein-sorting protein [Spirochaetales bacterium]|nr:outer membrane lipoprotein-sorting protein [Spirochaetales bacterium]
MRRLIWTLLLFAAAGSFVPGFAEDLDMILNKNENQPRPPGTKSEMKMIIVNKAGQERTREILAYSKNEENGDTKQVLIFQAPADVKNTRFLTIDYKEEGKESEQYIYIPALRKVRTIGTSGGDDSKTGAFLGSDFTYANFSALDAKDFNISLGENETVENFECYTVLFEAKNKEVIKNYGYTKIIKWIRIDEFTTIKTEYFDNTNKLVKRLILKMDKKVDGKYWTFDSMTMYNLETGGKTIWKFETTEVLTEIKDSYFTKRFLERGR